MAEEFLLGNRSQIQLGAFISALIILLVIERLFPRRDFQFSRPLRTLSNLSLAFLNNFLLQISFPILVLGAGYLAVEKGWGLFQIVNWPGWLELILGVLLLDLIIYGQHLVFHFVPFLWRLHRVHHADLELDVTTGIRFHPIEILISMGLKIGFVLLLGAPPLTVFSFELLLMLSSMFNHSNLAIPLKIDRILRYLIITPDVHRVHHSIHRDETNSNYGFNVPWWDRVFGTYTNQPRDGHGDMLIGIDLFRSQRWLYFHRLLIEPFVDRKD